MVFFCTPHSATRPTRPDWRAGKNKNFDREGYSVGFSFHFFELNWTGFMWFYVIGLPSVNLWGYSRGFICWDWLWQEGWVALLSFLYQCFLIFVLILFGAGWCFLLSTPHIYLYTICDQSISTEHMPFSKHSRYSSPLSSCCGNWKTARIQAFQLSFGKVFWKTKTYSLGRGFPPFCEKRHSSIYPPEPELHLYICLLFLEYVMA
jgi:hypothetical protein